MKWKNIDSEHYLLFYHPNSIVEKDLPQIEEWQEKCYQRLSSELQITLKRPIRMYLCDSAEEIAQITGCPACNGMTFDYDLIYVVYNDSVQCLGPHEDAHIFSYQIATPDSLFLREGFAMYFDEYYHGKHNIEIAKEWYNSHRSFSITTLIDNRMFWQLPEKISYPLAGSFAAWIIQSYGMSKYLEMYRKEGDFCSIFSVDSSAIDFLYAKKILED